MEYNDNMMLLRIISIGAVLVISTIIIYLQNRHFEYRSPNPSRSDYVALLRSVRIRGFSLMLLLWLLAGGWLFYELNHKSTISYKQRTEPSLDEKVADSTQKNEIKVEEVNNPQKESENEGYLGNETIDDETSANERQLDILKERYEDVFVSYLYLRKCNQAKEDDYGLILEAFTQDLKGIDHEPELYQNVYEAAEGSYLALYAESPCDENSVSPVFDKYDKWINQIADDKSEILKPTEDKEIITE